MKPEYKTTLFHNKYVIGYHTNNCTKVQSFASHHFVNMDSEFKEVQWIAEQYLTHAFHVASDNECAFTGGFMGIKGDELMLFLKVQSTDINACTRTKYTFRHFKVSCNLNAHINTVLKQLIQSVQPVTHDYIHKCCLTVPICVCLGEYDPYYMDSLTIPTLLGAFQGAKPYIYCDTKNSQTPRVHYCSESDHHRILRYLHDNYHMGLNLEAPSGQLPELSFYNELPPIPPSPTSTVETMSNRSNFNSVADEDADQLIHDWSSD